MPEFQKKIYKLTHKGMSWNHSIDTIPDAQIAFGRNIRVTQQQTVTQRPGLTGFVSLSGGTSGVTFIHSNAVLNNYNQQLVNFTKVYVMAGRVPTNLNSFFVGPDAGALANATINPVRLPSPGNPLSVPSGNPVTFVDMAPIGTPTGWKYIGDASLNFSVGYYPGDSTAAGSGPNHGMARAITMGMTPPINTEFPYNSGTGPLVGNYQWCFAYRNKFTGARSNPSAPTRQSVSNPFLHFPAPGGIGSFSTPQTPIDPQTGAPDTNIWVDIYRFGGTINRWVYVGTEQGGIPFNDNIPDANLQTASGPSTVTDPITGVSRFNVYRPFVFQANAVYSTNNAIVSLDVNNGAFLLNAGAGDSFNLNWIQGSPISVSNKIFTIYQVRSSGQLELAEDGTGILTPGGGSPVPWATQTGNLVMGQALPHIWGPYGTGQGGAYIFGCGGSLQPGITSQVDAGTLYWTNGNDPDSTDIANSLVITGPSEPLRGGCCYDGTPYCWSTERMFRIYPGNIAGQFTVQEIPGGKGLWAEFSLTVQSTGNPADQSITWVGKDGIYDWSASAGLVSLTDRDMYPFFPHDNQPGMNFSSLFPTIAAGEPLSTNAPDYSTANMPYHRLCWFMGELFYDFPSTGGGYNTLVFDTKQANGWVSLDQYSNATNPVSRGIEIAANNLNVAIGPALCTYTGNTDAGATIPCRLVTRMDDLGDARTQKLWGDYMFDAAAGTGGNITVIPVVNYGAANGQTQNFTVAQRSQLLYPVVSSGLGALTLSFGFDLTWNGIAATNKTTLYQYEVSFVPKPEFTNLRVTDKTDDGYLGAKYLRGLCIECNTFGNTRSVNVLVDGANAGTLSVTANGQLELPYAITPLVGSEFQLQPTDTANTWELFSIRWVWEKWPDLDTIQSNWLDLGTTKPKYIRAFTIPVSGPAVPTLAFTVTYDGTNTVATNFVAPSSLTAKSPAQYSFNPPILAHQIKLAPTSACRCWYDEIKWDAEEWPELAQLYGPVENLGSSGAKYLRGFELPIETGGASVEMTLFWDQQTGIVNGSTQSQDFVAVTTSALSKNVFPYTPVPPVIAHEFQLRSKDPARFWYSEVKWDFEPWPEYDTGRTPWLDGGTVSAKFVRGITMPVDTGGLPVLFDLFTDTNQQITFGPFTTIAGNKTAIYCGFTVPLVFHEFQLTPRAQCRVWYDEIKWDADPWPELEVESSSWGDAGYPGAKFMQGLVFPLDTNGVPVTFDLITDNGTYPVGPFTTPAGQKTTVAYSFPVPFICHNLLLTPRTACRAFYSEIKWVWEPEPELVTTYTTQATDHDLPGYNYLFDAYIAYIGSADAPNFLVTTEYGTVTYPLPVANGVYTRAYLLLNPQKSKWKSYSITSTGGIRLFLKDCEVRCKNWTDKGNYPSSFTSHMPFGAESRLSGARI